MATPIQPVRGTVKNQNYVSPDGGATWVAESQPGSGGGGAVTIADGADVAEGATTDIAVTGDNAGTVSGKLRGINKILFDVWDSIVHAFKVQIQNATLAVTQSGTWTVLLGAGTALIGKFSIDQTTPGTTNGVVVNSSALPAGAATETTLGTRLSESDFDTKIGSLTETAPATDTASSGLNGRLQRIAQRITSLITAIGSPFQAGGSIGNTTFGSTTADGGNVVLGTTTGAKVITDATGTIQQYLRGLIYLFVTAGAALVTATLAAGSAVVGKFGIDQTTPGTTNRIQLGTVTLASSNGTPISSATTTDVAAAPAAAHHLEIYYLHASNGGATATWVGWKEASGTLMFNTYLPQGGVFSKNLDGSWHLSSATKLQMVTSAAGSVEYTVGTRTEND